MILRVPISMLCKGMFVESVECSDLEFSGRRFLLESDSVLADILATSAESVLVNSAKNKVGCSVSNIRSSDEGVQSNARVQVKHRVSQATLDLRSAFDEIKLGKFDIDRLAPAARNIAAALDVSPSLLIAVTRLKTKDEGTYVHSLAVGGLMIGLGELSGLGEETNTQLTLAGLLHDIGKLLIPAAILHKNGYLSDSERRVMRSHPERGYAFLKQHPDVSDLVLETCRFHHEAIDGSGYPLGIAADRLSLPVRICTVCDVIDALTSIRPYKRAWTNGQALRWMFERGHLFDKKLACHK